MSMGGGGRDEFSEINVTPLTDVFLVLLVIMILIAPLIDSSDLKIKPPKTLNAKKVNETKGITIDVDKEGKIAINGHYFVNATPEEIGKFIAGLQKNAHTKDLPLTLNADGDCRSNLVMEVMSAARESGIKRMRIATRQASNY